MNLPRVTVDTDRSDSLCFGCGQNNPIGLKLEFRRRGDNGVIAEYTPGSLYQGWRHILHGGILACLLDEAASHAAYHAGAECVTAGLTVRFKQTVEVGQPLVITAAVTRQTRKIIEAAARVSLADGTVVAEGTAKQYIIGEAPDKRESEEEGSQPDD